MSGDTCYCDYEQPEFSTVTNPVARRQHRCYECGSTIQPGERYERVDGKWDGYLDTFKTCPHCTALRKWVTANLPCFCWGYGNVIEDAREAIQAAYERAGQEARGLWFGFERRRIKARRARAALSKAVSPS